MAIPIPSNLPQISGVDFRQNDLVTPPSAPNLIENINAIDPRVALKVALPVGDLSTNSPLLDSAQVLGNPAVEKAVILEITSLDQSQASNIVTNPDNNLVSQSLSNMDSLGSAALGQLLSDLVAKDEVAATTPKIDGENKNPASADNIAVTWPGAVSMESMSQNSNPKISLHNLYANLQNSGIFAADQLRKLIMPADEQNSTLSSDQAVTVNKVKSLVDGLTNDNASVKDAIKLLLRGELVWQGQLLPNVYAKIHRSDAWGSEQNEANDLVKGSKLTLELNFPNLGPVEVVGTQFDDIINIQIKSQVSSQSTLAENFSELQKKMDDEVSVSLSQNIG